MTLPPVIGLNGVARAGKDTVAKVLHEVYGYKVYSFSDILNETLLALDPFVHVDLAQRVKTNLPSFLRYTDVVATLGYEGAKEIPEVRRLLQAMGTEVGRTFFGENVWVDALFRKIEADGARLAVITNVRFPNEYESVKLTGGQVWRVTRPGFEAALGHVSDTALDEHIFDWYIDNGGTVRDLAQQVNTLMEGNFRMRKAQALA